MKKLLLKTLAIISVIGGGHADPERYYAGISLVPGNHLRLELAEEGYQLAGRISMHCGSDLTTVIATKPVELLASGGLYQNTAGNASMSFEDTLTLNSAPIKLSYSSQYMPLFTVKGNLAYIGAPSIELANNGQVPEEMEINIYMKDEERKALFDISRVVGGKQKVSVNGNKETLLEYYNALIDRNNTGYTGELPSLDGLKDSEDAKKDDLVSALRTRLRDYLGNANYSPLKNMKVQDYIVEAGERKVEVFETNKVKCVIEDLDTLIDTNTDTKTAVDEKEGLSLIPADVTGMFDFYTAFNTQGENSGVPNAMGKKFVQWPSNVQLPLSNSTSNNTDFEFKTTFISSEAKDIHLTGGEQNVETVRFTGPELDGQTNNTSLCSVILHGSLKNMEFASNSSGYMHTDFTNVDSNEVSLRSINGGIGNIFKRPPAVRSNQKLSLSMDDGSNIELRSLDNSPTTYKFDKLTNGNSGNLKVGNAENKNVTLII